jgi:hypothetical protein
MRHDLRRPAAFAALCIAALSIAGCASSPRIDGGIVGSGNRIDCAALEKTPPPDTTIPEECKP